MSDFWDTGKDNDEELLEEQDSGVWLAVGDLMSGLLMFFALLFIAVSAQLVEFDNIIKKIPLAIIEATKNIEGVGDSISVEPNGDLSLDNKILFNEGESTLAEGGKTFLRDFLPIYSEKVFSDPIFEDQVSRIIIEGHTSSSGSAELNMQLSFQRALSVSQYINTLDFPHKNELQEKILVAGRGETDASQDFDDPKDRKVMFRFQFKRQELSTMFNQELEE